MIERKRDRTVATNILICLIAAGSNAAEMVKMKVEPSPGVDSNPAVVPVADSSPLTTHRPTPM